VSIFWGLLITWGDITGNWALLYPLDWGLDDNLIGEEGEIFNPWVEEDDCYDGNCFNTLVTLEFKGSDADLWEVGDEFWSNGIEFWITLLYDFL
jgi:hypothetical protein